MTAVAAVILAAGASSRFRAADAATPTKLVAELHGMALVRHVALAALASQARPVVVVTGHAATEVMSALDGLDVAFVHNADFAAGLSGSLRLGLAALSSESSGALVLLGDMPQVGAPLVDRLITAFESAPGAEAIVPMHDGQRGNPCLIGRTLFAAASRLSGDEGARRLLAKADVLELNVADAAVSVDIDDPETLRQLSAL